MGKTFFIADLHFGHKNILAFDNRPFPDVEAHDAELIRRWNSVVGIDDDVWILGDISWHNATKTIEIFKQLNGVKHLCKGNHDGKILRNRDIQNLFIEICDYKELQLDDGKGIVLCHYPIPCYRDHFDGWCHLYGHVHTGIEWNMMERDKHEMFQIHSYTESKMYNVGCMVPYMEYRPKTLDQIENDYRSWVLLGPFFSEVKSHTRKDE